MAVNLRLGGKKTHGRAGHLEEGGMHRLGALRKKLEVGTKGGS